MTKLRVAFRYFAEAPKIKRDVWKSVAITLIDTTELMNELTNERAKENSGTSS